MEHITNSITVRGNLQALPQFSHENHGRQFYRFSLEVERLSGAIDILPVVIEKTLLDSVDPTVGSMITVSGQIRSYNQRQDGVRHLLIFVYATIITVEDGQPENQVCLTGTLCRDPNLRRTPLGREICDIMLAVRRPFHRSDYLPCILWGRTAQILSTCQTGDTVSIQGRLQSRIYTKLTEDGPVEHTAYEISALTAQQELEEI